MPIRICVFLMLLYRTTAQSESQTIFHDTMDNFTFNWIPFGPIRNEIATCSTETCTSLGRNGTLESAWLSTSGYQHIELLFTMQTFRMSAHSLFSIYYSLYNVSRLHWTLLAQYNNSDNNILVHRRRNMPSSLDDQPRFKIKFHLSVSVIQNAECVIDDIYLMGQSIIHTTQYVTTSTTSASTIHPNVTAIFSDNYLKILISITFNAENVVMDGIHPNDDECDAIFVETHLLGPDARCIWYTNRIEIQLTSTSVVDINDRLVIASTAFRYIHSDQVYTLKNDILLTVLPALHPIQPLVVMDHLPSTLGICDDLILNAALTQHLGGRNAIFEWRFILSAPNDSNSYLLSIGSLYGDIVWVPAAHMDIHSVLSLQLRVTTWFHSTTASNTFTIHKIQQLVPHVVLSGPNTFSVTNYNYKHDYIHIVSTVSYNVDCINASAVAFPYSLSWSVSSTTLQDTPLQDIQNALRTLQNVDHIAVDTSLMLPGNDYIFKVDLHSNTNTTSASLTLWYEYSEIMCSVNSADAIYVDSWTEAQFARDYILLLDGYTMTYDPNALRLSSKSHLTLVWECTVPQYNLSCNDLFDSSSLSTPYIKYISFTNHASNLYNMYRFTMTVSDSLHTNRNPCVSHLDLILDFKPSTQNTMQYLSVSISVTSNVMISDDRLRITVLIIRDELADGEYYEYEWMETNHLISKTGIEALNINDGLNGNLILESNVLQRGFMYTFQVNVTKWIVNGDGTSTLIGNGVSPTIDIHVLNGPMVSDLTTYPNCNQTYSSLYDLLTVKHYISANGDGDYPPLFYEFVYYLNTGGGIQSEYSLHPSVLFKPYLLDTMLPFGSFTLKAIVYDSKESSNWKELQCNIVIQNAKENECISLTNDILNPLMSRRPTSSSASTQLLNDIVQLMPIYLQYIGEYYGDNAECLRSVLSEIVSVFNDQQIFQNVNFCQTDWSMSLGQIFAVYFETLTRFDVVYDMFRDPAHRNGIQSIVSFILDPCHAISNVITHVDLLFLSPQSIIDGNVIIYYGPQEHAIDITNAINQNILSSTKNTHILYQLSSSLIAIINLLNGYDDRFTMVTDPIMDLLSKSLYIHALYSIATSIPGETVQSESEGFEIYSSRIGVDGEVDVSVHDIQITIDNGVFADGRDSFCDLTQIATNCVYDSVDVVIIAQNNTNTDAVVEEPDPCNEDMLMSDYNGSISNHSISISIIGGNLTTSTSNATITFTEEQFYRQIQCVWLDEETTTWKDTGCQTIVHQELNSVECKCSHLTTFSLAYNINVEDECDNILAEMMANSAKWNALHVVFAVLFMCLCIHSLNELSPFILNKKYDPFREKTLLSVSCVFIISLINVSLCISFTSIALNSVNIQFLTFLLLSPQWFYFIIFGIVLYSWVLVSQSLEQTDDVHPFFSSKMLSKLLQITTIVLIVCGMLEFLIISLLKQSHKMLWIYSASQIFWICLLLVASIIFSFFGYKTQQIVRITAVMLRTVDSGNNCKMSASVPARTNELIEQNIRLSKKLLLTTVVVTAFFLIQCILCIYFLAINHYQNLFYFRILDLLSHYICLLIICLLYKQTFNRLRAEYEIKSLCHRECMEHCLEIIMVNKVDPVQTRQTAPSVSVTSTVAITRNASNSVAKSVTTNTVSGRPPSQLPSVQMSETSRVAIVPLSPLTTIKEALGHKAEPSLSLSLIDNASKEEESHSVNPVKAKTALSPRVSVFERKELLKLNTAKLARMCREQNLSSKGTKADIVRRLVANASKCTVPKLANLNRVASKSYD